MRYVEIDGLQDRHVELDEGRLYLARAGHIGVRKSGVVSLEASAARIHTERHSCGSGSIERIAQRMAGVEVDAPRRVSAGRGLSSIIFGFSASQESGNMPDACMAGVGVRTSGHQLWTYLVRRAANLDSWGSGSRRSTNLRPKAVMLQAPGNVNFATAGTSVAGTRIEFMRQIVAESSSAGKGVADNVGAPTVF